MLKKSLSGAYLSFFFFSGRRKASYRRETFSLIIFSFKDNKHLLAIDLLFTLKASRSCLCLRKD